MFHNGALVEQPFEIILFPERFLHRTDMVFAFHGHEACRAGMTLVDRICRRLRLENRNRTGVPEADVRP